MSRSLTHLDYFLRAPKICGVNSVGERCIGRKYKERYSQLFLLLLSSNWSYVRLALISRWHTDSCRRAVLAILYDGDPSFDLGDCWLGFLLFDYRWQLCWSGTYYATMSLQWWFPASYGYLLTQSCYLHLKARLGCIRLRPSSWLCVNKLVLCQLSWSRSDGARNSEFSMLFFKAIRLAFNPHSCCSKLSLFLLPGRRSRRRRLVLEWASRKLSPSRCFVLSWMRGFDSGLRSLVSWQCVFHCNLYLCNPCLR